MSAVRTKNTAPELVVRSILHRLGYRYRLHAVDLPGCPDIVFRKRRCVLFVNGCFWHGHHCRRGNPPSSNVVFWRSKMEKNRNRDSRVKKELRQSGWRVLTVWECETKVQGRLERRLCRFLNAESARRV